LPPLFYSQSFFEGQNVKVKIVSGNQAGQVHDLPQVDAESAIATGYAVAAPAEEAPKQEKVAKKAKAE
jgi:hypothetical protein